MNTLISPLRNCFSAFKPLRRAALPFALLCTGTAFAQSADSRVEPAALSATSSSSLIAPATLANNELPDDPSARFSSSLSAAPAPQLAPQVATKAGPIAPKYSESISAGFNAQPWTQHVKFVAGVRDVYSPISLIGDVFSAGYAHITNGSPNYGVDKGAFGQRLGATAIRDASETFLYESVMASVLRQDPRYYVEGPRYNLFHRTLYAVTRPIITRTDSGHATLNSSLMIGYAGASALSYTYYPAINQNFKDTASTFGGSLAGAAVGDFVNEFADDVLQAFHLEKRP